MGKKIRPSYYQIELPDGYVFELRLLIEALDLNFYLGAALKHLCRAGLKPGCPAIEDIVKAETYLGFERDRLERQAMQQVTEPDDSSANEPPLLRGDDLTRAHGLKKR
jgi:hypothetical protein